MICLGVVSKLTPYFNKILYKFFLMLYAFNYTQTQCPWTNSKEKKVTKDLSMVLKPIGPTNFKMLKQKIRTWDLFAKMYFFAKESFKIRF